MIKIEHTNVYGWEAAIRGMRNPMNSWDKIDSHLHVKTGCYSCKHGEFDSYCGDHVLSNGFTCIKIGNNDLKTMKTLSKAGSDHAKYLRMINVTMDVTCHHTWWAEFDTYKVATVRNSCSKMHKIHVKEFVKDDFSHEGIDDCGGRTEEVFLLVVEELERLRNLFNKTQEKKYWRAIIELLPMGYNIKATIQLNYQVLKNIYHARKTHKIFEWHTFCAWCEELPYFKEICIDPCVKEVAE